MLTKGITLSEVVKAYAAEKRRGGQPPTPEQLAAYEAGRLSEEDRESILEFVSLNPEAARFLLQLSPRGADVFEELSEDEMEADWKKLSRSLGLEDSSEAGEEQGGKAPSAKSRHATRLLGRASVAYGLAAAFFILALAAFLWNFQSAPVRDGFGLIDVSAESGDLRGVAEHQRYKFFPAYSLFYQNDDWSEGQRIRYSLARREGAALREGSTRAFVNAQGLAGISIWLEDLRPGVYTIQVSDEPGQSFEILPPE